jgi:hypothetical protein
MRLVLFAIIAIGLLWVGDMLLFRGRYANDVRLAADRLVQDFNYQIRKWVK